MKKLKKNKRKQQDTKDFNELTMSIWLMGIILITIGMPENVELISENLSLILAVVGILLIGFYELIIRRKIWKTD